MMKKTPITILFIAVLAFLGSTQEVFAQRSYQAVVNGYIAKAAKAQQGEEYRKDRKVVLGDLDSDGDKDVAVQYTLEGMGGGNNFAQMLAIFRNDKGIYKFVTEEVVGGKMDTKTSMLTSIAGRKITLATSSCSEPPQGMCKNPKKGRTSFVLNNGKLAEM